MRNRKKDSSAARGVYGEDTVFFHLRQLGFTVVARQWRRPGYRGELDLVAWEDNTLCFIEVKTRGQRGVVPAEFAVDEDKQRMLKKTAAAYIAHLPREMDRRRLQTRFDVASVYLDEGPARVDLYRDVFR